MSRSKLWHVMVREGLRDRTRRAVRAELSRLAVDLFSRQGFEQTTVDDITTAAGLSKRSFFRYFPTKEDAVFGDLELLGDGVVTQLRDRPRAEAPWDSLHRVLREWSQQIHAAGAASVKLRLIESTPALRARFQQEREQLRLEIAATLRERHGESLTDFDIDLLTGAAGAALDAASREVSRTDAPELREGLVDRAFAALRPAIGDSRAER
ncbi:MAG: TetR family transcriptional regulator [Stackebrandtia sp.]